MTQVELSSGNLPVADSPESGGLPLDLMRASLAAPEVVDDQENSIPEVDGPFNLLR